MATKLEIRMAYVPFDHEGLICPEPSLTKQSFAEECDYNAILEKWQVSGVINHLNPNTPQYIDVSEIADFATALQVVNAANDLFAALPAKVRNRFLNDPARLVEFLSDPENRDEAVKLGLVSPPTGAPERPQEAGAGAPVQPPQEASKAP